MTPESFKYILHKSVGLVKLTYSFVHLCPFFKEKK